MPAVRRPLIAGNWKLFKTVAESCALVRELASQLPAQTRAEVVVAPVFTALASVKQALAGSVVRLSAQNLYWEPQGAFTGEVGPLQLRDVGCDYVIVGHSERRQIFGESDADVNRKARAVLAHGMAPIVCVGETLAQREAGQAEAVVVTQVTASLAGLSDAELARVVVAYEPVWAIGTGKNAAPSDAQQMHAAIRACVTALHGQTRAGSLRILYGGSVKADNAAALLAQPDVDGALVGGASLAAGSFCAIVAAAG
ncbi:MAG TPA: triose-phosphate isomerase [Polyangiales bacterium]